MSRNRLIVNALIFVAAAGLLLGGCTMSPKYERPAAPVPNAWPAGEAYGKVAAGGAKTPAEMKWEEFFTDANLRQLVAMALKNNRDLRLAALNVEKARALYGIQRAELFPAANAVGTGSKGRTPADLSYTRQETTYEQYGVNFGVSAWEIDFFGRIRSLKDRALEEYFATDQARRSAQILLVSAVANAYLTLAADRESLKLTASTLEAQEHAYKLIKRRYEVGMASELDLRRAQSQVDTARGDVARYTQMSAQDENALQLLVGSPVPAALLPPELGKLRPLRDISAGLSSEVLLNRPDIRAAEHRLRAANANIGAARAAFFPRISLTTSFGTASADLSGLFRDGSSTWNFAPQIVMPIFDARLWSLYDATKVEKEITIAQYERAIQTAFRETADALAVQGTVNRQIEAQKSLVDAFAETYRLSGMRYQKGIDSYLSVLDAQRSLYGAQKALISLQLFRLTNDIALYKALGGGA
ncbi:MAG TPA: efflux transporter outer membrane subunit [Syntrophales bacterium]|jgi:multidrug efflux system outer membrane protein|nr:efflux transporter outer membrane subunit [Syntrophales bacterium]HOU77451.1 efflux transporter outer membrane subunit [Syntrophales bacterium]HPC31789.1 efflux transporter outer membrane subunit [Syntrophales bacterium]HQG33520.1 efflux transporter outer membrane subunit [Syntrophales bacterium]HQI34624.1 efflux transporter outer membrane subunit [Syntrophales bacterium]